MGFEDRLGSVEGYDPYMKRVQRFLDEMDGLIF